MKFSDALDLCMRGKRITRSDWNGKGMYIWYVPPHKVDVVHWKLSVPTKTGPTKKEIEKGYVELAGHFDMMNAQGIRIIGWVASQTDLSSDNWEVVE